MHPTIHALRTFLDSPADQRAAAMRKLRKAVPVAFSMSDLAKLEARLAVCEGVARIKPGSNEQILHAQSLNRDHPVYPKRRGTEKERWFEVGDGAWAAYSAGCREEAQRLRTEIRELESQVVARMLRTAGLCR